MRGDACGVRTYRLSGQICFATAEARQGMTEEVIGMNEATATLVERLGVHDKRGASFPRTAH